MVNKGDVVNLAAFDHLNRVDPSPDTEVLPIDR